MTKTPSSKTHDGEGRGWQQYLLAKQAADERARREQPEDLEKDLQEEDKLHLEVYLVASQRISQMLHDKEHYVNGKLEPRQATQKVPVEKQTKGRLEVFRQLTLRPEQPGCHAWQMCKAGVQCKHCKKKIKGCATHGEIAMKQDTACIGYAEKTMEQQMKELVDDSSLRAEGQSGHRWFLQGNNFGCRLCWERIPRRSGKTQLQQLQAKECITGPVDESELHLRMRIHPSHALHKKGRWIECQQCLKHCRVVEGRAQQWVHQLCTRAKGQMKLKFGRASSDS